MSKAHAVDDRGIRGWGMKVLSCGLILVLAVLMGACNDGSKPPAIHITSHSDGQVVADGKRDIVLAGVGSDLASVHVRVNGVELPVTSISFTVNAFVVNVVLGNNANTVEVTASNTKGALSRSVITIVYPFVGFSTFQAASVVIGQAGFNVSVTNPPPPPTNSTVNSPVGRLLVSGGKLFLPDGANNRVLVYESVPTENGASASRVMGQPDFQSSAGGSAAAQLQSPQTVMSEAEKLFVVDRKNHRVLIFDAMSGGAASVVVGWDGFDRPATGCARNRLYFPASVFVVGGKLLVADGDNHRVLIWNRVPTVSGASADLVLGQLDFNSCVSNGGLSADGATLNTPTDVWSDGNRIVVADSANNRVLIWNSFPVDSGVPADVVVGQNDFAKTDAGGPEGGLVSPRSIWSNGNQLFVAERNRHRVMVWNMFPAVNGAGADVVLGQSSFSQMTANDDDQNDISDPAPTARTLYAPEGVALWGKKLFVTDRGNNRYLVFEGK